MVTAVTSLTGNGLKDWLIQRFTALLLLSYFIFILGYIGCHPRLDYVRWSQFFHSFGVEIATTMTLFAFLLHAWIGIWTVITDYVHCIILRLILQGIMILVITIQVIWGLMVIWVVHG